MWIYGINNDMIMPRQIVGLMLHKILHYFFPMRKFSKLAAALDKVGLS